MDFLSDLTPRTLSLQMPPGWSSAGLYLGNGASALEVAVVRCGGTPQAAALRALWKARHGGRPAPVLVVALYNKWAALCGVTGTDPVVYDDVDGALVERVCRKALEAPNRHAASRYLEAVLPELCAPIPGLRNEHLLAIHELQYGVKYRRDWKDVTTRGAAITARRGRELLASLGFEIADRTDRLLTLKAGPRKAAVALLLDQGESIEARSERYNASPISYALARADDERLPYVIILAGSIVRLYTTDTKSGAGRRGRTETFIELNLDLLRADHAGYLWLLFSADALKDDGVFPEVLRASHDYAVDLGGRLRKRVYEEVIPHLAKAVADARNLKSPTVEDLHETYLVTLTILFRILFIAYAEDKDLLPLHSNANYELRSLKRKAKEVREIAEKAGRFDSDESYWRELLNLFDAVDRGKSEWGVPAYNGGLFSSDAAVSPVGAAIEKLSLPNTVIGDALYHLLIDSGADITGPVDFRSLGVREFGTIYEGLLESELAVAEQDLTTEQTRSGDVHYRPVRKKTDSVVVPAGAFYLHNRSGARKATGSYFTKDFAVNHLLDSALEPAMTAHCARLDALTDNAAGDAFFDFRVADVSSGSGHFLVAVVDRIERALTHYISKRPLAVVTDELERLRQSALKNLGREADIEDAALLRRQIARRCIYAVDINPMAIDLARLSLWVHTFVPGLPLSFLDRNIVCGNSLIGVATFDEVREILKDAAASLFGGEVVKSIAAAEEPLLRLGKLSDASMSEVKSARDAARDARKAVAGTERFLDVLAATRLDGNLLAGVSGHLAEHGFPSDKTLADWRGRADDIFGPLHPFHFPIAFPEVFLRDNPGFDLIVGNPPWEEATVEEDAFWARHFPGLRGLKQVEQETLKKKYRRERKDLVDALGKELEQAERLRFALVHGGFPGMGTGDPDVYKAFCWRFWSLTRNGGHIGVVLPRSVFCAKGSADFRRAIFDKAVIGDLTFMLNNRQWFFEDVHPQYTIGLFCLNKQAPGADAVIPLRGPYSSLARFEAGHTSEPVRFPVREVLSWTDTASLPLLPGDESAIVFAKLRRRPRLDLTSARLDTWRARPTTELHATNEKHIMTFSEDRPSGAWPVFKGESFDIWQPDTKSYYAWVDPKEAKDYLYNKRLRASRTRTSAFSEFEKLRPEWLRDKKTLPCLHPRIAFRDITRATDTRTMRAALVPPKVVITNAAPYLVWPNGDERDTTFLLGILCSRPLDWYARRFVEIHVNFYVFNPFPIPRPNRDNPLWQRVVAVAGRLACPDDRFAEWAETVGVDCGSLEEHEKQELICELDALAGHLYGLDESDLVHVFETFHEGWDCEPQLKRTLAHYHTWRKKI